jgi:hypothetical protein
VWQAHFGGTNGLAGGTGQAAHFARAGQPATATSWTHRDVNVGRTNGMRVPADSTGRSPLAELAADRVARRVARAGQPAQAVNRALDTAFSEWAWAKSQARFSTLKTLRQSPALRTSATLSRG